MKYVHIFLFLVGCGYYPDTGTTVIKREIPVLCQQDQEVVWGNYVYWNDVLDSTRRTRVVLCKWGYTPYLADYCNELDQYQETLELYVENTQYTYDSCRTVGGL